MAPALVGAQRKPDAEAPQPAALLTEKDRDLRKAIKSLHEQLKKNAEHVGRQFPKLAREMHYGETEKRSIYGDAKPDEVRSLLEEGVEVQPLPTLPEDQN